MGFPEIIDAFRRADPGSDEALQMEMAFNENTHNWADLMIHIHMNRYEIDNRNRSELWEIVKKANIDILKNIEIALTSLSGFMEFYLSFINEALLVGYFQGPPRLAEVIRKNLKFRYLEEEVLPQLRNSTLKNISDRKIQEKACNPAAYDSWKNVKDENYPRTIGLICESETGNESAGDGPAGNLDILRNAPTGKEDMAIRKWLWEEVAGELERKAEEDWDYDRKPVSMPKEETGKYFRTTVNWFLMNYIFQSDELRDEAEEIMQELIAGERYCVRRGTLDQECLADLLESFKSHGPSDYFKEHRVGVKGKNLGVIFDKVANGIYNRLLFPELAQILSDEWGVER